MQFSNTIYFKGFNVETVEYKNISFTVWDVGGQVCIIILFQMKSTVTLTTILYPMSMMFFLG